MTSSTVEIEKKLYLQWVIVFDKIKIGFCTSHSYMAVQVSRKYKT